MKIKARIGFDLTPAGSSWVLKQSDSSDRTTLPASGSKFDPEVLGPVEYTFEENLASAQKELPAPTRVTGDGMKIELINHEMWKQFGETMEMEKFKDVAAAWGGEAVKKTQDTVDALTKGLQNTLILPAGNVFEFKQLNADPRGHVYTLVTYKTPTDLVQTANN